MSVHYKFKSGKDKHTVIFDGLHISVADLKKAIMQQRKIGKSSDLDLQITNPQTGEVYESDSTLIPKNTSVDVARVPVTGIQKKSWDRLDTNASKGANSPSHIEVEKITKSSNISTSYGTEDEKIKAMMSQSTQEYDPSKYVKNKGIIGPLPSNYTCYRCGQPGHYIKQCPTNNSDIKRSTGIPRSFMIPANADQKGALLTASGDYAVPIIDHEAYKEVKKEKPPFIPNSENDKQELAPEIPNDLKCELCKDLLLDAVLIPCCGSSYCDECIRSLLLESENHECPSCHEVNVSPDTLIPNRYLRTNVTKFKNDTGYHKELHKYVVINENKVVDRIESIPIDSKPLDVISNEDLIQLNDINTELSLQSSESPPPMTNTSDVTMDEVILGSPKKDTNTVNNGFKDVTEPSLSPNENDSQQLDENNESNDDGNDSQHDTATGSNTPLVDEPSDGYENTDNLNTLNGNPVVTVGQYNQPLLSVPVYPRPTRPMTTQIRAIRTIGQQSNHTLLNRPQAILPHPRGAYPRPGMTQDIRNYYRPMTDPRGFPMSMSHTMPPYNYAAQMRPPAYHDPYGYMGPRSHLPSGPMHHQLTMQGMAEAPPPGSAPIITDTLYHYSKPDYDDYEDRVNRFTRQLESRSRGRPKARSISRSRSRSRSHSRSSRSSSGSSSSSTSSSRSSRFSFSSRSFSGSSRSRSRSYSPRRRSRSRSHYRRRSRSISPRRGRDYRYRRSRSPRDSRKYSRRRGYDERERETKFRDSRTSRYDRNDPSFRSHRSDDKKKETKSHSSRCHKSSHEKTRNLEKQTENEDSNHKNKRITPLKDEEKTSETNAKNESNKTSIGESNEAKVENDSNKTKSNKSDNNSEKVDNKSNHLSAKSEPNEDKSDKKRSREKSRRHHKHHHHNHHHKHRKGSEDSKSSKTNEESKNALNKKTKKTKKETIDKVSDVKPIEDIEHVIKESVVEKMDIKVESEELNTVSELMVPEFPIEMLSEKPAIDLINEIFDTTSVENIENQLNIYPIVSEMDPKVEENIPELMEYISTNLPNYSTLDFSADCQPSVENPTRDTSDVKPPQLVDYTDNEELVETTNELNELFRNNVISDTIDININTDSIKDNEILSANAVTIEVPKSKWDEDINDLRFEEEYSDFESDNHKLEAQNMETKSSHKTLPNDIIEKAEKAILEKPLRAAIVERRDKNESNDSKKHKSVKSEEKETKRGDNESNESRKTKREKDSDKEKRDNSYEQTSKAEDSEDKSGAELNDASLPRKVKLDRSKFTEKPTLSITIDNSEKEKSSRNTNRSEDKDSNHSKSYRSRHKSRDRSKDRSRSDNKSSHRKKSSKTSKPRDESRHRSHKRSRRSRSLSSNRRHKTDAESQKKSKSKYNNSSSSKKSK